MNPKPKGNKRVRMDKVTYGSRELTGDAAVALRISVSERMRARQVQRHANRHDHRPKDVPDRQSVEIAVIAVETRLVKAFWTIARQPIAANAAPRSPGKCGLEYFHDPSDILARYADAAGGKWESEAPRRSLPSSRAIDEANAAIEWLLLIPDENMRRLLVAGATSKRGDMKRRIPWPRIRPSLAGMSDVPQRTLQWRYKEALRIIVSELTLAPLARQC